MSNESGEGLHTREGALYDKLQTTSNRKRHTSLEDS